MIKSKEEKVEIEKRLLTLNPFSRLRKPLIGVHGIVIHWVANANSSALSNCNYFESLKNQKGNEGRFASAHYIIGLLGEVIQCLPEEEMAYHVGANKYTPNALKCLGSYPNNCTLGIELYHPEDPAVRKQDTLWIGRFTPETLDSCRKLILSRTTG
jgi:N-acetylmuramoyl-L-alanine amidase